MLNTNKLASGSVTRSRTAVALIAATLLVGGSVTEASAKSRHHRHHQHHAHHAAKAAGSDWRDANGSLPFGTKLRVTHGGQSVVVTVNDRGPFIKGRVLDLSTGAARAVGLTGAGVGRVVAEVI